MRALTDLKRYPAPVLFLTMALCAGALAWISFGLLGQAMANADLLIHYRLMALLDGGLWQALSIAGRGVAAMLAYLVFKGCEVELIARWRAPPA